MCIFFIGGNKIALLHYLTILSFTQVFLILVFTFPKYNFVESIRLFIYFSLDVSLLAAGGKEGGYLVDTFLL